MPPSLTDLIKQGVNYPKHMIQGHLQKPTTSAEELVPGEGAIVDVNGKKVAAYKNDQGQLVMLSPICTHMACVVGWNGQDKTWDCPCHGSRYTKEGKVMNGPATKDLNPA